MSEEILKALMQLFAIITKQDEGAGDKEHNYVREFLLLQISQAKVQEYLDLYNSFLVNKKADGGDKKKLTSVTDSVTTLGICRKINKTLTQKQKIVVLIRLFDLIRQDQKFTSHRLEIIITAANVFNISNEEYIAIKDYSTPKVLSEHYSPDILTIAPPEAARNPMLTFLASKNLDGFMTVLYVATADLCFIRYEGKAEIYLNGLLMKAQSTYLFASGSTVKVPKGKPIYYSDVIAAFRAEANRNRISFEANIEEFRFPAGNLGLKDIHIQEESGKLIGLMGASGAGKTTLLNVLAGNMRPMKGQVLINGIDVHNDKESIKGVIGFIAQDDLLMEGLTVFENLYFNAKLCFKNLSKSKIRALVEQTLEKLGLLAIRDVKVGNVLNKKLSGGQRKRLNIALEMIREPLVFFVDEPTSGLSSRDSENVMDLLKEIASKGKLIFVVIHQPSSDIFKMFDKVVILDTGGLPIYYGNPVEAVIYFKNQANLLNNDQGQCESCGSVHQELIFNTIETKTLDEYGQATKERKFSPQDLNRRFKENIKIKKVEREQMPPENNLNIVSRLKQWTIFLQRDFKSKITNTQYLLINLLEAPLLAALLAFIIRYSNNFGDTSYSFSHNDNIAAYIFMGIIVAMFMGLTVSAEEIFRDKKILKREAFLNLSRSSYLLAKVALLFSVSAIQTLSFVIIGNLILGIQEMHLYYWAALFTVSCFAQLSGLIISASFNSVVTIYILIPILLIPQMILSGAMFSFDKMNKYVGSKEQVPIIGDMMASRWAFEAMMVNQFKNNRYEKLLYKFEKEESRYSFNYVYLVPELMTKVDAIQNRQLAMDGSMIEPNTLSDIKLVSNTILEQTNIVPHIPFDDKQRLENASDYNSDLAADMKEYLRKLKTHYSDEFNRVNQEKDNVIISFMSDPVKQKEFLRRKKHLHNLNIADLVKKSTAIERIYESKGRLVQLIDPIYMDPINIKYALDYRTHFYAPRKHLFERLFDTFHFNLLVIWGMTLVLYIILYKDLLRKGLVMFETRQR